MPIPASLRAELGIEDAAPASGGCIHQCYEVRIAGERRFLKLNDARYEDAFAAEADGWRRDNYIGLTPQHNGWCDDWAQFWVERRLRPQLELAAKRGFRFSMPSMKLLQDHKPQPALVHGDLWSGNARFTEDGPVVFDPAVYYGDREADLAMTELFGGFAPEFYASYQASFPLDEDYQARQHLYNL